MARFPFVNYFMAWGIRLVVPKQRIGAGLVALDEKNRVLLLRHVFHPYTPWGIPGGWLNRHEAPADGVLRELREETGLTAVLTNILHIESQNSPPHMGIVYLGRIQPGRLSLSAEIIEAGWFSAGQLPGPLTPLSQQAIESAWQLVGQENDKQNGREPQSLKI